MSTTPKTRDRIMDNLIKRYGKVKTRWFIEQLKDLVPFRTIAVEMDVTYERVGQWALALGQRVVTWTPYDRTPRQLRAEPGEDDE